MNNIHNFLRKIDNNERTVNWKYKITGPSYLTFSTNNSGDFFKKSERPVKGMEKMQKNKSEIILVGGGGHCKSCIDVLETENKFTIKGIIDLPQEYEKTTLGYDVIGNDTDLPRLAKMGFSFLWRIVASISSNKSATNRGETPKFSATATCDP